MIYGERIKQARDLKGLTQSQLADAVGIDQSAIAHFEAGRAFPSPPSVSLIALETGVRPGFFELEPAPPLPLGSLVYRARSSMRKSERDRAHQYLSLLVEQMRRMSKELNLPMLRFPSPLGNPVRSARLARIAFDIDPLRPVAHIINAMERHGAVVFGLPLSMERIDAFSSWVNIDCERPVIALKSVDAGDRVRFSAAHELGHLVMHKDVHRYSTELEEEANAFAAEFLLPEEAMRKVLTQSLTLESAARLKQTWRVSIQMIIHRANDLGIITQRRYRTLFKQIGVRGWRTKEPGEVLVEHPRLFRQAAELLYDQDYVRQVAEASDIGEPLAKALLSQYDEQYQYLPGSRGSEKLDGLSLSDNSGLYPDGNWINKN